MGLINFGRRRIGFWMAERTGPVELPGRTPFVEGTPVPGGATLVLVAGDEDGEPVWSLLLHEPEGASLLLPWGERLVVGLGARLVFLDDEGTVHARYQAGEEWTAAWPIAQGLVLIGRQHVHLLGAKAQPLWQWAHGGESVLFMDAAESAVRLAVMGADDWREVQLDLKTGRELLP